MMRTDRGLNLLVGMSSVANSSVATVGLWLWATWYLLGGGFLFAAYGFYGDVLSLHALSAIFCIHAMFWSRRSARHAKEKLEELRNVGPQDDTEAANRARKGAVAHSIAGLSPVPAVLVPLVVLFGFIMTSVLAVTLILAMLPLASSAGSGGSTQKVHLALSSAVVLAGLVAFNILGQYQWWL
jgi:hypothetical protein